MFTALKVSFYSLIVIFAVTFLIVFIQPKPIQLPVLPKFSQLEAGDERKQSFFNYMSELVNIANQQILADRAKLLSYQQNAEKLWWWQKDKVNTLAEQYGLETFDLTNQSQWKTLLRRVDIVPPSLALAQAANESAWGTSRFARKANNFFGQWCYVKGCGLVPNRRNQGAFHEVAKFESPFISVKGYMQNINTHRAYKTLRNIRQKLRKNQQKVTGIALADGLSQYSEKRHVYVSEIKQMIRYNDLDKLD
ncbi:glucosaminidase domain-containing protein [Catenovulum sp. 2E275]|uniref:glucosaminidase domain-containing protein n=1 Tax=Catenovulum sp. 2E275 TaxID=2980497 RepID=UPI0021D03E22|nr:glucosaminidase domain-containing protein [Catenovulum sp. 2E275]MCU4675334.1 glucosaminidase domain-containing protein [Catenovulum sp. 2E275]